MTSAYIIANVDRHRTRRSTRSTRSGRTAAMQAHGAEVCVRGGKVEVLEGDWTPERVVVLKFPSVEAAKAFYDSRRIRQGRARRARAPRSCAWSLVEGV